MRSHWAHIGVVLALLSALTLVNAQSSDYLRGTTIIHCNYTAFTHCVTCVNAQCVECASGYTLLDGDCWTKAGKIAMEVVLGTVGSAFLCALLGCCNHPSSLTVCWNLLKRGASKMVSFLSYLRDCLSSCWRRQKIRADKMVACLCGPCAPCLSSCWRLQKRGTNRLVANFPCHGCCNKVAAVVSTNLNEDGEDISEVHASELPFTESKLRTINEAGTFMFLKREGQMQSKKSAPEWSDYGFLFFQENLVRIILTRGSAGIGSEHTDRAISYGELVISDVQMEGCESSDDIDHEKVDINGTVITSDAERIARIKRMLSERREAYIANQSPDQEGVYGPYPIAEPVSKYLE